MISSPFGFEHVSHVDAESTYGIKKSLNIEPSRLREFLPQGKRVSTLSDRQIYQVEEEEEEEEETRSIFKSSLSGSIRQMKPFSFNKTPPTSPFKRNSRGLSSNSLFSKGESPISRRSTQSMSSVDYCGSSIIKVSTQHIPHQHSDDSQQGHDDTIIEVESENDFDCNIDLANKFNSIAKPPNIPILIKKNSINEIPIDSDSDTDDEIQLLNCYLPVDKSIGELKISSPIRNTMNMINSKNIKPSVPIPTPTLSKSSMH